MIGSYLICMEMCGSGVKIGIMKKKKVKFFVVVRGSSILIVLVQLFVAMGILLVGSVILGFVFSELYLRFLLFFSFGVFSFFFLYDSAFSASYALHFNAEEEPRRDATDFLRVISCRFDFIERQM